ncbi:MAG: helix-turn-helix domain-containing protein [Chitinophagales bacterium]
MGKTKEKPIPEAGTELRILDAARRVFTRKGFAAARMEDIAREAGMNRALLHYYFRSKQKMYDMIFEENLTRFYANFMLILGEDVDLEEKIHRIVSTEIDMLMQNPDLPLFIVNEVAQNPELMKEKIRNLPLRQFIREFSQQIEKEAKKGKIKKVEPLHIIMHIMSLCIFPFVGRPMMQAVTGIDQKTFEMMMQQRKKVITEMILSTIKKETV